MGMNKMIANDNTIIEGPQLHFEHPNPTMRQRFLLIERSMLKLMVWWLM
ncbi:MAG: hypothetical protein ACJAXS_000361 [Colwellia sp.]|jgi:hypothetical protein